MPPLYIGFTESVPPATVRTYSRQLPRDLTTLQAAEWLSFLPNTGISFSSWFHGDTPTPSRTAPGNEDITPKTVFPPAIKDGQGEYLPFCRPIPDQLRNIGIEVDNTLGVSDQKVQLVYQLT